MNQEETIIELEKRIIKLEKEVHWLHSGEYCPVCGSLKSKSGFCLNRDCPIDTVVKKEEKPYTEKELKNVVIEKDARAELVRLQKETYLFEHGFYDKEIQEWIIMDDQHRRQEFERECGSKWNLFMCGYVRKVWFKEKFPEFFEVIEG